MQPFKALHLSILTLLLFTTTAGAQGYLKEIPVPDVTAELEAFKVADGFEVNLFASEPMIANPIHMNWDAEGRLWVAGSAVYPYIAPGEDARDTITILEDTDGDGAADKSTIFAEGLFIPTGVLPGDGGVYVSNSTELLHLQDRDGDGKADFTRTVLSGFGTEDTHHILHTLYWGVDGSMYMNQSIYIHSHIETPHGVKRLNGGGIWRFRPRDLQLDVLCYGFVNPWGHKIDKWGQSFATDGAYGEGINYVFPGASYITSQYPRVLKGLNNGQPKHCGLEIINGSHFPEDWQGNMITNDFRAHRVCRFVVEEEGTAYSSIEQQEVLKTTHGSFRPVDNKMGPDGALYIADWYNPIIQHGEVDFRDPRRDHEHGRIWRVTAKDRPLLKKTQIVDAEIDALLNNLKADEPWVRVQSQRELLTLDRNEVLAHLSLWLQNLKVGTPAYEHHRLMALWTYQTLDEPHKALLEALLESSDHKVRAAAIRVLSHWHEALYEPEEYLARVKALAEDEHPRVRLEAVRMLGHINDLSGVEQAFTLLDKPMDRFTDHALWLTARETASSWLPLLETEEATVSKDFKKLHFLLSAINDNRAVLPAFQYLEGNTTDSDQLQALAILIVDHGTVDDMQKLLLAVLGHEGGSAMTQAKGLDLLREASARRNMKNSNGTDLLLPLLESDSSRLRESTLRLLGTWGAEDTRATIQGIAENSEEKISSRKAALDALASLGGEASGAVLNAMVLSDADLSLRVHAVTTLASVNLDQGIAAGVTMLESMPETMDPTLLLSAIIQRDGGSQKLAEILKGRTINREVAKRGQRAVSSSGGQHEALVEAIRIAGGLGATLPELTPEALAALVDKVNATGDPARGEAQYRALECAQCHAIGGGGGMLGPDLSSIAGSAPVDYLIESLLYPDKAIKEGYHSLIVDTSDFETYSGIKVSETDSELVLRTATVDEIRIDKGTINARQNGQSLMPTALTDELLEQEFIDLVRFLAALGKDEGYEVGTARAARTWRTMEASNDAAEQLQGEGFDALLNNNPSVKWLALYASPNGDTPLASIPESNHRLLQENFSVLQCDIELSQAGTLPLNLNLEEGVQLWVNEAVVPIPGLATHAFTTGRHTLTFVIDRKAHTNGAFRLELGEAQDGNGSGQFVLGR